MTFREEATVTLLIGSLIALAAWLAFCNSMLRLDVKRLESTLQRFDV